MSYSLFSYISNPLAINTDSITWNRSFSPYYNNKYSMLPKFLKDDLESYANYLKNDIEITKEAAKKMLNDRYGIRNAYPKAKKVYYDEAAGVTVVLWTDNTKTIVRAAKGDKHDAYLGYCAALAKKIHGTNSALKRDLEKVLVRVDKKEKGSKNEKG